MILTVSSIYHIRFFGGGWGSNSRPYIFYALSIPTELSSQGHISHSLNQTIPHTLLNQNSFSLFYTFKIIIIWKLLDITRPCITIVSRSNFIGYPPLYSAKVHTVNFISCTLTADTCTSLCSGWLFIGTFNTALFVFEGV